MQEWVQAQQLPEAQLAQRWPQRWAGQLAAATKLVPVLAQGLLHQLLAQQQLLPVPEQAGAAPLEAAAHWRLPALV